MNWNDDGGALDALIAALPRVEPNAQRAHEIRRRCASRIENRALFFGLQSSIFALYALVSSFFPRALSRAALMACLKRSSSARAASVCGTTSRCQADWSSRT